MRLALASHLLPDFLLERCLTLADALEKCLKKGQALGYVEDLNWAGADLVQGLTGKHPTGKGEEQALAAAVLGLLCVQLGPGPKGEELFHGLKPLLVSVLSDCTASPSARLHVSVPMPCKTFLYFITEWWVPPVFRLPILRGRGEPYGLEPRLTSDHGLALSSQQCASTLGLGCYVAAADIQVSGLWTQMVDHVGP